MFARACNVINAATRIGGSLVYPCDNVPFPDHFTSDEEFLPFIVCTMIRGTSLADSLGCRRCDAYRGYFEVYGKCYRIPNGHWNKVLQDIEVRFMLAHTQ